MCLNYTRQMIKSERKTDIIDLVCYTKDLAFPEGLKFICEEIGMSYYHDFDEDIPESFKILKMIEDMNSNSINEKEKPLKPINECILSYYKPYVNDLFAEDYIDYLDCGDTPPDGSQYWVASFVSEYVSRHKGILDEKFDEYLRSVTGMQI